MVSALMVSSKSKGNQQSKDMGETAIGRLINECSRAKAINRGKLYTTLPKQAPRVAKEKTTFKHRGLFPTRLTTKAHIVV